MSNGLPFAFNKASKGTYEAPKGDPFRVPMPTFWAVEEPHVVNDAIPRDIKARTTNQSTANKQEPAVAQFKIFDTNEAAVKYAQMLNRPLVILEINTVNKVIPQLPSVVKYQPPKQETAVLKIDDTAFSNKG